MSGANRTNKMWFQTLFIRKFVKVGKRARSCGEMPQILI